MNASSIRLIYRTLALLVVLGVIYAVAKDPFRVAETRASVALLGLFGAGNHVIYIQPYSIAVLPSGAEPFEAVVTLSCSSLASALSIICMGAIAPRGRAFRRTFATLTAVGLVVGGNIVRITVSIVVGIFYGRGSLVLFHDWAGSTFTFIYTLGGFMIMLMMLMDKRAAIPRTQENHVEHV